MLLSEGEGWHGQEETDLSTATPLGASSAAVYANTPGSHHAARLTVTASTCDGPRCDHHGVITTYSVRTVSDMQDALGMGTTKATMSSKGHNEAWDAMACKHDQ